MHLATAFASLLTVGMAAAASCAAQNILDACLASTTPQLEACEATDWSCQCEQSNNVLTCYNNCPNDSGHFGAQQKKVALCNAAKAYATTTTTTTGSSSHVATATAGNAAAPSSATSGASSSSENETSDSSSSSTSSTDSVTQATSSGAAVAAATGIMHVQGGLAAAVALGLGAFF